MVKLNFYQLQRWSCHRNLATVIEEIQLRLSQNYIVFDRTSISSQMPSYNQPLPQALSESEQIILLDAREKGELLEKNIRQNKVELELLDIHRIELEFILNELKNDTALTENGIKEFEKNNGEMQKKFESFKDSRLTLENIDDYILDGTPCSKQIIDLVAENKAINDLMVVFIEKKFKGQSADVDTLTVREFASKEFHNKELLRKIARTFNA
eukprot:TRINITY_DN7113_c0_g1_i10.p1 TRINITY_DN7113_c0_g1~~TRINITY_DN7113_c0_g1_i10.p1  ORF type:complete len:212 (+),score=23.84 TRINITY_DN7113_c0_g1_i10:581-1216(+)